MCPYRQSCRFHSVGEDCVACWLYKRISRSLGGAASNPDMPNTFINHMSSHISKRFVKNRQVCTCAGTCHTVSKMYCSCMFQFP